MAGHRALLGLQGAALSVCLSALNGGTESTVGCEPGPREERRASTPGHSLYVGLVCWPSGHTGASPFRAGASSRPQCCPARFPGWTGQLRTPSFPPSVLSSTCRAEHSGVLWPPGLSRSAMPTGASWGHFCPPAGLGNNLGSGLCNGHALWHGVVKC